MTNTLPEFKYTAQGKKVRIMGKLNSTEYIVQEVFVDDKGKATFQTMDSYIYPKEEY